MPGKKGDKGPPGPRGEKGPKGEQGPSGPIVAAWEIDHVNYRARDHERRLRRWHARPARDVRAVPQRSALAAMRDRAYLAHPGLARRDIAGDERPVCYLWRRNVSRPWPRAMPYTNPCRSSWVHRRWGGSLAG